MNAMLEPSMVAARTQGPDDLLQGFAALPERMTPSSHGCLPILAIPISYSWRLTPNSLRVRCKARRREMSVGAGLVPARSVVGGIINKDGQDEQDEKQN